MTARSMSTSDLSGQMGAAAARLAEAVDTGSLDAVPARELQLLLAAAVRAFSAKREGGEAVTAFLRTDGVTATDVAVTASALLEAAEIAPFELGMWQTIKGRS